MQMFLVRYINKHLPQTCCGPHALVVHIPSSICEVYGIVDHPCKGNQCPPIASQLDSVEALRGLPMPSPSLNSTVRAHVHYALVEVDL